MQVTPLDIQAEIHNLAYLFYGYSVVWVIVLGYLVTLWRRESSLRHEIDELKRSLEDESPKK
jgi:CcmD family protein